jgi:hypothetical protein
MQKPIASNGLFEYNGVDTGKLGKAFQRNISIVLKYQTLQSIDTFPGLQQLIVSMNSAIEAHKSNLFDYSDETKSKYFEHLQTGFSTVLTDAFKIMQDEHERVQQQKEEMNAKYRELEDEIKNSKEYQDALSTYITSLVIPRQYALQVKQRHAEQQRKDKIIQYENYLLTKFIEQKMSVERTVDAIIQKT